MANRQTGLICSLFYFTYNHDRVGNRTSMIDLIEGTPSIDFGYDANGNITSENTWTYVYDLSNQLVRVLQNSNQVAEYTYNGAGQRIKKVTQTETRIFHYDLWSHLIAETNQSGTMIAEYVYLGDQLLAMIRGGQVYYFHNDHLGTPQVLTDDSQTVAWKAVYTPFGEAVPSIQTVENPFRFPGQYYDQETGLHYNYFRYYNPQTGRYITPDPIGLEGGINLFTYVENNPVNFVDPSGTAVIAIPIAVYAGRALLAAGTAYLYTPAGQEALRSFFKTIEDIIREIDEEKERAKSYRCETREPWQGPGDKWDPNKPPDGPWWKKVVWALGQIARLIKGWPD